MTNGTSIRLSVETRDRLARYGYKNESYDTLLNRILDKVCIGGGEINGNYEKD